MLLNSDATSHLYHIQEEDVLNELILDCTGIVGIDFNLALWTPHVRGNVKLTKLATLSSYFKAHRTDNDLKLLCTCQRDWKFSK